MYPWYDVHTTDEETTVRRGNNHNDRPSRDKGSVGLGQLDFEYWFVEIAFTILNMQLACTENVSLQPKLAQMMTNINLQIEQNER